MQRRKRGNGHKRAERRSRKRPASHWMDVPPSSAVPEGKARLTLHETDSITDNEETIYSLFYQYYRGYTIYSTEQGQCCIHGPYGGCLRINGNYAHFPYIEEAKTLIKWFRVDGRSAHEHMNRDVPGHEYVCLNKQHQHSRSLSHQERQPIVVQHRIALPV